MGVGSWGVGEWESGRVEELGSGRVGKWGALRVLGGGLRVFGMGGAGGKENTAQ